MPAKSSSNNVPKDDDRVHSRHGQTKEQDRYHKHERVFETFGTHFHFYGDTDNLRADQCPFCGGENFYLNIKTGQFTCNSANKCGRRGNVVTYLTWLHRESFKKTSKEARSELAKKRAISPQTVFRHELAHCPEKDCWLIPFTNKEGNIVNIQRYFPNHPKPNKLNLPGLPTSIYNFEALAKNDGKPVFLCEGPFDAMALDYAIGPKHRDRYVIVATPGSFSEKWAGHFRNRKVTTLFDNDQAGMCHRTRVEECLMGGDRIAEELRSLKWPANFGSLDAKDINDLIRQFPNLPIIQWINEHTYNVEPDCKLAWSLGWKGSSDPEHIDWPWPYHIRCGSYCSFSGKGGEFKSTIAREFAARYTRGLPQPGQDTATMPAGFIIYIFAEETEASVRTKLIDAGADMNKVILLPATLTDGDTLNLLDQLPAVRSVVRSFGVRLVIIDGQNSLVGAPNICTDMLARSNVTNKLHHFAQAENIALVGIRNEDNTGRALGPQSMGDIARCIMRTESLPPHKSTPDTHYFILKFPKVSDAPKSLYPDIPYAVADLPGSAPKILWGKSRPLDISDGSVETPSATEEPGDGPVPGEGESIFSGTGSREDLADYLREMYPPGKTSHETIPDPCGTTPTGERVNGRSQTIPRDHPKGVQSDS